MTWLAPFAQPFVTIWTGLTQIANLSGRQVRSLVTVGFLAGMISLSVENWGLTFYFNGVVKSVDITPEKQVLFVEFLSERLRYTSVLQGLITVVLGAVVLNADRLRFKAGGVEGEIGGD